MRKLQRMLAVMGVALVALTAPAAEIQTVLVGNAGNAPDSTGYGAVAYPYEMGKFEITAGQYTEFLNAVAKADPYTLYNTAMNSAPGCKIARTGTSPNYVYTCAADRANRPVTYASWADAARFANWMHNGQPTGAQGLATTENGSYYLNGLLESAGDAPWVQITRKPEATWVVPTENEWYKAAYHKNNGATGDYWHYATSNDTLPSNQLLTPDAGNNANYTWNAMQTIGSPYYRTIVGEFENSVSPYGTLDQTGNVKEWVTGTFSHPSQGWPVQGMRGGSYAYDESQQSSSWRMGLSPGGNQFDGGFRLGYLPEPGAALLLLSAMLVHRPRRA